MQNKRFTITAHAQRDTVSYHLFHFIKNNDIILKICKYFKGVFYMKSSLKFLILGVTVIFLLVGCKKENSSDEYEPSSETSTTISSSEVIPSSLTSPSSTSSLNIISLDDLDNYFSTNEISSLMWVTSAKEFLIAANPDVDQEDIENDIYTLEIEKDPLSTDYDVTIACGIAHSDVGRFYSGTLSYQGNGFYTASISEYQYDNQGKRIDTIEFTVIFLLEKHGEQNLEDAINLTMQSYSEDAVESFNSLYLPILGKKIEYIDISIYDKENGYF